MLGCSYDFSRQPPMALDPAEGERPHRRDPGWVNHRPGRRFPVPSDFPEEQAAPRTGHSTRRRSFQRLRQPHQLRCRRGTEPGNAQGCRLFPDLEDVARRGDDPAPLQVLAGPTGRPYEGAILGVRSLGLSVDCFSHGKSSAQAKYVHRPTFQMRVVRLKPYSCQGG